MKKNSGITLIALVITIIIMLIIATVSVTMLAGDNSLIHNAGEAKEAAILCRVSWTDEAALRTC